MFRNKVQEIFECLEKPETFFLFLQPSDDKSISIWEFCWTAANAIFFLFLCSYSSLRSIIWNEILGVRASFRVVTVGHYRVFRWMNGAFVHWLLFSTFWDKKKNLFLKTENVNRIFYYTKLVLNIVTFWEILFLRCLSEKCQGFGNELWFFG